MTPLSSHAFSLRRQAGFTLLEILIAITVLAIGLLGLAALQLNALQTGQVSYQRSQAIALAYEIADRMRANRIQAGAKAFSIGANPTLSTPSVDCASASCTAAQMAAYDLYHWYTDSIVALLPSGTASIACNTSACGTGVAQTITVMWDENRTGASGTTCGGATTDLSCFQMSFTP